MIESREIISDQESGLVYSNQVTLFFEREDQPGTPLVAHIDPDGLYEIMHQAISGIPGFVKPNKEKPATPQEQIKAQLSKLMRAGIKGLLIAGGPMILDVAFGTKDHPKPGKQDDLLVWYQDMFTRLAITHLMRNDIILSGSIEHGTVSEGILRIHQVTTRPITQTVDAGQATGTGGTGTAGPEPAGNPHTGGTGGQRPTSE